MARVLQPFLSLFRLDVGPLLSLLHGPRQPAPELLIKGVILQADVNAFAYFRDFNATGASVWPSTHVLAKHILDSEPVQRRIAGGRVLELGSGLGLVGMATAVLGARSVCLTDRRVPKLAPLQYTMFDEGDDGSFCSAESKGGEQQLDALRGTLSANREALPANCELVVEELSFGDVTAGQRILDQCGPFDVVLGSDITYLSTALPDLARTLRQVAGPSTLVLLGHNRRRKGLQEQLFEVLAAAGFIVKVEDDADGVLVLECCIHELV